MQSASMKTETEEVVAALPNDVLAVVLGRVPVRSLAASRGVCRAWRDLVDERQLLLRFRRLLPHSVRGLFINHLNLPRPQFLSRPTPTPTPTPPTLSPDDDDDDAHRRFDGMFSFSQLECHGSWYRIVDHCNGLFLVQESGEEVLDVCNPGTRWSARLPPWPRGAVCDTSAWDWGLRAFLVFDPFVSPEYKVVLSPPVPVREQMENDDARRRMEWPPAAWARWHEFSSSTWRWEEKVFVREGEAAGTAGDLLLIEWGLRVVPPYRYAAYWKGELYIHCPGEFVSRLSLLNGKYRVIKSPIKLADGKKVPSFLGRSEKGVYLAAITTDASTKLQVWTLCESSNNQMEWVPKDQGNLKLNTNSWCLENNKFDEPKYYWATLDVEPEYLMLHWGFEMNNQDVSLEQNVCWDSEDDNVVNVLDDQHEAAPYVKFLGFHPYKEVIFLWSSDNVVAFHLNSPKVQYLARVSHSILESFVFTPCLIGD